MISGSGSTLFEELGLYYIGPVDGHEMSDLVDVLQGGPLPLCCPTCRHRVAAHIVKFGWKLLCVWRRAMIV